MNNDAIANYIETGKHLSADVIKIDFKQRQSLMGLFIEGRDYEELKSKNFWRIVLQQHAQEWKKTGNINLCRIFNGSEITRLTVPKK